MVKIRSALRKGGGIRKLVTKERQKYTEFRASVSRHQEQKRLNQLEKLKKQRETLVARRGVEQAKSTLQSEINRHKAVVKTLKRERLKKRFAYRAAKRTLKTARKHVKVEIGEPRKRIQFGIELGKARKKARRVT